MKRITILLGCLILCLPGLMSQELNCRVEINSDKIQGTNKQVFTTLQEAIMEYINNRKWSNAQVAINERIECTIMITVNTYADDHFACDIQVQSRRPVYNSSYSTTLFNFKDTKFEFDYREAEPLIFNENTMESNLTAVLNYYVYMILALDFDSFSPQGGSPFLELAGQVVAMGQSSMELGWKAFEDSRNRHALLSAFTDQNTAAFRQLWYNYHRKGLDEMALSVDKGRANITESLKMLKQIYDVAPMSVLLPLFKDSKLDELVNIYSKAKQTEKDEVYELLNGMYPTETTRLEKIKEVSRN